MNLSYVREDLLELEGKAMEKIEQLIYESMGTLPIERLNNGRKIIALSRAIRLLIDQKMEDEAEILLALLLEMGVPLRGK